MPLRPDENVNLEVGNPDPLCGSNSIPDHCEFRAPVWIVEPIFHVQNGGAQPDTLVTTARRLAGDPHALVRRYGGGLGAMVDILGARVLVDGGWLESGEPGQVRSAA